MYPELVGVVGWNVPNYQGVFLRGYGGQTSYHYGAVGHWSAGLGELQGDGIREIWGELSYLPRSRDGEVGQSGSLAFWNEGRNQWMNDAGKAPSGAMNFYASRSTPVVGEVRPVNRVFGILSEQNNFHFKRKSQKNSPANRLRTQCTPARRCPAYPARHPTWHLYRCPHRPERTLFPEMG